MTPNHFLFNILYFLRNFPAWIPLLALFVALLIFYKSTGDLAYKDWASLALASLFTALGIQRTLPAQETPSTPTTNINAKEVSAPINTDSVQISGDNAKADNENQTENGDAK